MSWQEAGGRGAAGRWIGAISGSLMPGPPTTRCSMSCESGRASVCSMWPADPCGHSTAAGPSRVALEQVGPQTFGAELEGLSDRTTSRASAYDTERIRLHHRHPPLIRSGQFAAQSRVFRPGLLRPGDAALRILHRDTPGPQRARGHFSSGKATMAGGTSRADKPDEDRLDRATVEAALAVAVRAPSIHNTQPWRWRARRRRVDAAGRSDPAAGGGRSGRALAVGQLRRGAGADRARAAGRRLADRDRRCGPTRPTPDALARLRPERASRTRRAGPGSGRRGAAPSQRPPPVREPAGVR